MISDYIGDTGITLVIMAINTIKRRAFYRKVRRELRRVHRGQNIVRSAMQFLTDSVDEFTLFAIANTIIWFVGSFPRQRWWVDQIIGFPHGLGGIIDTKQDYQRLCR